MNRTHFWTWEGLKMSISSSSSKERTMGLSSAAPRLLRRQDPVTLVNEAQTDCVVWTTVLKHYFKLTLNWINRGLIKNSYEVTITVLVMVFWMAKRRALGVPWTAPRSSPSSKSAWERAEAHTATTRRTMETLSNISDGYCWCLVGRRKVSSWWPGRGPSYIVPRFDEQRSSARIIEKKAGGHLRG